MVRSGGIKVRVIDRTGRRPQVWYTATVETPSKQTYLAPGTTELQFVPEKIASVYVPRRAKK